MFWKSHQTYSKITYNQIQNHKCIWCRNGVIENPNIYINIFRWKLNLSVFNYIGATGIINRFCIKFPFSVFIFLFLPIIKKKFRKQFYFWPSKILSRFTILSRILTTLLSINFKRFLLLMIVRTVLYRYDTMIKRVPMYKINEFSRNIHYTMYVDINLIKA